ncbi:MAG: hypothetical protein WBQ94_19415 [Terracidiphilus sp.]
MKNHFLSASLAFTFCVGVTNHAVAKVLSDFVQFPTPGGIVAWHSLTSPCRLLPDSAKSTPDGVGASVSFGSRASGMVGLSFNMPGIVCGVDLTFRKGIALLFSNPDHQAGCTISLQQH